MQLWERMCLFQYLGLFGQSMWVLFYCGCTVYHVIFRNSSYLQYYHINIIQTLQNINKIMLQPNNPSLPLSQVLTTLMQQVLNTSLSITTREQMMIKLLQRIDSTYFEYKFPTQTQNYDYQAILKSIVDYYNQRRYQVINNIFIIRTNYAHKFSHIFQLVLDLAFQCNKEEQKRYLQQIINMSQQQKQILMPYCDQVMKRKFIKQLSNYPFQKYIDTNQIQHSQQQQLLQYKDKQYQQLKQNYEEVCRAFHQLTDNHNNLKISNEKMFSQNAQIMHEKYELMGELGVHASSSFVEIAEKYKRDIKWFQHEIEKLQKQLEDKNNKLMGKQQEIKQLTSSVNNLNTWQSQKNALIEKNKKLQNQLKNLQKKQCKLSTQLQNSKQIINKLKQDIAQKDKQLNNLAKFKARYKGLKETHFQFKRNFIEKMKQN